jgi:hypothetical protein
MAHFLLKSQPARSLLLKKPMKNEKLFERVPTLLGAVQEGCKGFGLEIMCVRGEEHSLDRKAVGV